MFFNKMPTTIKYTYEQAKAIYIQNLISGSPTPPSKEILDILDKYQNKK
jgi:hypothetical protein